MSKNDHLWSASLSPPRKLTRIENQLLSPGSWNDVRAELPSRRRVSFTGMPQCSDSTHWQVQRPRWSTADTSKMRITWIKSYVLYVQYEVLHTVTYIKHDDVPITVLLHMATYILHTYYIQITYRLHTKTNELHMHYIQITYTVIHHTRISYKLHM